MSAFWAGLVTQPPCVSRRKWPEQASLMGKELPRTQEGSPVPLTPQSAAPTRPGVGRPRWPWGSACRPPAPVHGSIPVIASRSPGCAVRQSSLDQSPLWPHYQTQETWPPAGLSEPHSLPNKWIGLWCRDPGTGTSGLAMGTGSEKCFVRQCHRRVTITGHLRKPRWYSPLHTWALWY